jgi:hypothetical protein
MRKKFTDKQRIDFIESAGYSLDLWRSKTTAAGLRVYPHNDGTEDGKFSGRTVRAAVDKAIRAQASQFEGRRKA